MNSISETLQDLNIKTRPNASIGYWLLFLFPISIIVSGARNLQITSHHYKLATLVATGFFIASVIIIVQCSKNKKYNFGIPHIANAIYTSSLFYMCLHRGILFSIISGFFTTFSYVKGLPLFLQTFPRCFTFGEASLIIQAAVLFLYITPLNIMESWVHTPTKTCHISNIILQMGITGVAMICFIVYKVNFFRKTIPFYALAGSIIFLWVLLPLHIILQRSPILWILSLLTEKLSTITLLIYWLILTVGGVVAIAKQIEGGKKANTVVRKIFHVLAVAAFLPGLIDQCSLLYLATGIVFALFVGIEMLRILNLPPLGSILQDGFTVYSDEKDAGGIALTPIYLLVGSSIPIWIHPEPCDVTDTAGFHLLPLIAGLLSVGVGDTMASLFGMYLGSHKWPGSKKTIEGTIASILGQLILVYLLIYFGYILNSNENIVRAVGAAIISSFIEAKTDQVDNLILPLVAYVILV